MIEDTEAEPGEKVGEVDQLPGDPKVGLVGPVELQRLAVGESWEGEVKLPAEGPTPHPLEHALADAENVVHAHERHLDVDLRELRLPIRPQVFVAQAARDLKIAIVAGHHQELLVELRRLRKRVELAGIHAAGNQVVPRTFRRPPREERRLDLQEPLLRESLAGSGDRFVPYLEVPDHLRAAKVQHPVAETELLGRQRVLIHIGH